MAHYLIFIPDASGCDPNHLKNVGLGELLRDDDQGPRVMEVDHGPEGLGRGVLLTWATGNAKTDPKFRIHDKQKWTEAPSIDHPKIGSLERGRYWVGVDTENPVQPADLQRVQGIGGLKITLADGYAWTVPTISRLPNRYAIGDGGEISRVCKDEYQKFYEAGINIATAVLDEFGKIEQVRDNLPGIENYGIEVSAKDGLILIASALALNYRLNWELCFLLELLDDRTGAIALMQFCELAEIREVITQKKTLGSISIDVGLYS